MKKFLISLMACTLLCVPSFGKTKNKVKTDLWPDGTAIAEWFRQNEEVDLSKLGKQYKVTDYGVVNDGLLHTSELQALIDKAAKDGGGVIVVPEGTYMTGAVFFKQGVHLHVMDGGVLMGSSNPSDYPILKTRIEGETCLYYSALINADGIDGFTITGKGTIDGNGYTYWKHFWERRSWNPRCTNKDEQRPRLIYVSNCKNVQIDGLKLQNSAFWTTHIYNSENVRLLRLHITSPAQPVKAPSTDAIDLDVVKNVIVKDCYMSVNDDAVAIKGGKGPYADYWKTDYPGLDINKYPEMVGDGANSHIIIEDCEYGFCHGCLTLGSESVHDRNIILRRIKVNKTNNLLWLKMRPDTPQLYEYVTVEDTPPFPGAWQTALPPTTRSWPLGTLARHWDGPSETAACAAGNTIWARRPSGPRSSGPGATAPPSPAARSFTRISPFPSKTSRRQWRKIRPPRRMCGVPCPNWMGPSGCLPSPAMVPQAMNR